MWLKWFLWKYMIGHLAKSHGFLDPIAIFSHIEKFSEPSEVAVPLELLRAGAVFHARGLVNNRVVQQNLDWVWPYWIERQFDPSDDAFIPRAFSLTHVNLTLRNWTAVGMPGFDGLPIVDPRGLLTPFWDGWSLDTWIVTTSGRSLIPAKLLRGVEQKLLFERGLALETISGDDDFHLRTRSAVEDGGRPRCVLNIRARAARSAWLVVSARPYNPEGISFIHRVKLSSDSRSWQIGKHRTVRFSEPFNLHAVSDYKRGDVRNRLFEPVQDEQAVCDVGMASCAALYELKKNQSRELQIDIPLTSAEKTDMSTDAKSIYVRGWDEAIGKACRMSLPNERLQFLWDAAVRTLVLHCPNDVYPGPYTYKRFWFRDAAFMLNAMLCLGLSDQARRAIDGFFPRQKRNGYFCSQEGEWDSNGQVLWLLHRFCQLTGRTPPAEWLDPVRKAAAWISRKRLPRDMRALHRGLMPAGFSAEHLGLNDYYYWDDYWSVAGLRAASTMLKTLGDDDGAEKYRSDSDQLYADIERTLESVAERLGGPVIPASCYRRMDCGAVGSLAAGYPLQILPPKDEALLKTCDYLMNNSLVNGGFFQDMIHSGINPYLTLHMAQVLLRAGDTRQDDLVRTVADLASPTGQWPEAIHPRTGGGCMGDGQHAWASAEWLLMLRNRLLYEENHGPKLVLGAGVSVEELNSGGQISIESAPTRFGVVDLSIARQAAGLAVKWRGDWFEESPDVEIRIPGTEPLIVRGSREEAIIEIEKS